MTKSLGQINYESHQPLRAVHWPWVDLSVEDKTFFENGAQAVVAHVREDDAKPSMPAVSTVDHSELLQKIRKAAGDAEGKLMQDELVARIAANAKRDIPTGWQPIETAPKDDEILLYGRYNSDSQGYMPRPMVGRWGTFHKRWEIHAGSRFGIRPTHWMPLPAPPQGEAS